MIGPHTVTDCAPQMTAQMLGAAVSAQFSDSSFDTKILCNGQGPSLGLIKAEWAFPLITSRCAMPLKNLLTIP